MTSPSLPTEPSWSEAALRAAMPALAGDVPEDELRALVRWAGPDAEALALAGRGAALLGARRFCTAYAQAPETWCAALEGRGLLRAWQRSVRRLATEPAARLAELAQSPTGLQLTALVASGVAPHSLAPLLRTGWLAWRSPHRLAVPDARRPLALRWLPAPPAPGPFLLRVMRFRLAERSWDDDERACLAACLAVPTFANALEDAELAEAVQRLRRSAYVAPALAAAMPRFVAGAALPLRQAVAAARLEQGDYGEAMRLLGDRSRVSRVLRAHALLCLGRHAAAQRVLRALGPRAHDLNWELQWERAAFEAGDRGAEQRLRRRVVRMREGRERALVSVLLAEATERRSHRACVGPYERAGEALRAAGETMTATYCDARRARALVRAGLREEACGVAAAAWSASGAMPGAALRGLAALACMEAGVASREAVQGALRASAAGEHAALAREASAALLPRDRVPVLALGSASASLDGRALELGAGPPWRVLVFLARLPPGSRVSVEELFAAGWPGPRAQPASRRQRVHTALWTLRCAGLRDVLETVGQGRYRLRAQVIAEGAG